MNAVQQRQNAIARIQQTMLANILRQCYAHLEFVVSSNPHATDANFKVPTYIFGYPYLAPNVSIPFLTQSLQADNFTVTRVNEQTIRIKWGKSSKSSAKSNQRSDTSTTTKRPNSSKIDPFYYEVLLNK